MFRSIVATTTRPAQRALFSSSAVRNKSVTEKVSEVADKVNKDVGKTLAGAIEKGEKAVESTKESIGMASKEAQVKSGEAANVARGASVEAKQKTNQLGAEAKGKVNELKDEGKRAR